MRTRQLELTAGPGAWVQASWRPEAPAGRRASWRRAYYRLERGRDGWRVAEKRTFGREAYDEPNVPWAGKVANAVNASDYLRERLGALLLDDVTADIREAFRSAKSGQGPLVRLERPPGRRLGDDFYRQVAAVYRDAVARGLSPRKRMQEDTNAAQDTVATWIKHARRKGFLPPATPGKVSA